ncbi:Sec34-domain-containing protein [Trichoderma citrinoviride]|uniref:Conserved oligomeric Golgi complex subunit 3 n=1 Tax=Trichoderma citrinoviride TaxID=58853 RepID=A0A2T4BIS4_9HYPO|nr:Sec34-domain-containing protein [Trichoderma citrinoviride]PTB69213.1 Sec34-domain-containing protein [Trichoderma citrinoviride]
MYEDGWYSFVPELSSSSNGRNETSGGKPRGHQRKESLLQQPNDPNPIAETLEDVLEELDHTNDPPEPTLPRRASSYSDFYDVVKVALLKESQRRPRRKVDRRSRQWEALTLFKEGSEASQYLPKEAGPTESLDDRLLEESQREYLLYRDQLRMTERHLEGLVDNANDALKLLTTLSQSFQSVEAQTSTFQAQCEELLTEQRRLEKLADEVGTDLYYYGYLEKATRRLNAPGASQLVEDDDFGEMVENIDACIKFMTTHENYRERDSYLARYSALLTKALHLLDHAFNTRLDKVSSDIARQIAATKSESARHALAYGRFEEMMAQSYSLLPNVRKVVRSAYHVYGQPVEATTTTATYANVVNTMFRTYFSTRDRDLKPMTQHDIDEYQKEVKSLSIETASRNFVKQLFERIYSEDGLFTKIFSIELAWSPSAESAFHAVKQISTTMVHPGNLVPLATNLQAVLQNAQLQETCNVVGWLANEYAVADVDEEDSPSFRKYKEYAARLLADHLWPFTDGLFEAEIVRSIAKAPTQDGLLKIGPVVGGVASSNAYPLVKRAIELLAMFDQAMPKERSAKNSPVVFKIVRETIQVLQRAEARIKSLKTDTDPDLFMVKNLLILKNELVSLEIGDIRSQPAMQHFGHIWDTLSPQNWVGFFTSIISGNLWSRGAPSVTAKTLTVEDMSEQLDELLRQSIYAFTKRWASLINDSQSRKPGVKPIAKVEAELETILDTAFSNQPEVISKLKEAIQLNAQAQKEAKGPGDGSRRY